jgi:NAD(P)-dependent dehydrogenase (short-subunit alcohol dehydrogenase family)
VPVAVVTGANKGIGKEIARQLVAAGLTVWVAARDVARGEAAAGELGGRFVQLDVTDPDSVAAAATEVGALDILVNNAGVMLEGAAPPDSDLDAFRRTYETNLFGVLAVTNAFLPALRRSARARIVNVSSGTGSITWSSEGGPLAFPPTGSGAAYRSSKAALNALTVFYAQALAPEGILVNALAPGLRRTDLNARAATSDGDPAEAAVAAVRLALLDDGGPTGTFTNYDGTTVPW